LFQSMSGLDHLMVQPRYRAASVLQLQAVAATTNTTNLMRDARRIALQSGAFAESVDKPEDEEDA